MPPGVSFLEFSFCLDLRKGEPQLDLKEVNIPSDCAQYFRTMDEFRITHAIYFPLIQIIEYFISSISIAWLHPKIWVGEATHQAIYKLLCVFNILCYISFALLFIVNIFLKRQLSWFQAHLLPYSGEITIYSWAMSPQTKETT